METSPTPLSDPAIEPLQALFEAWLASRPGRGQRAGNGALSASSTQLYRDMWAVFIHHLIAQPAEHRIRQHNGGIDLTALTTGDLRDFLNSTAPSAREQGGWTDRYTWRMLHLIDRVLVFHQRSDDRAARTAAAALLAEPPYRHANAAHHDLPPEVLSDSEVERLIAHLDRISHEAGAPWKPVRDAAVVATMLGAGLGPADAQAMELDGIASHDGPTAGIPWRLTVPADGLSPQHQAPILPWAGAILARWLEVRRARGVPGTSLFPSTLKGAALSRMSCHRLVVGVLEDAGVAGGVPLRLRHTFAVRQLSLGHDEETVAQWLGLVETQAVRRYRPLATAMPAAAPARTV